jgi:hypothetical protein
VTRLDHAHYAVSCGEERPPCACTPALTGQRWRLGGKKGAVSALAFYGVIPKLQLHSAIEPRMQDILRGNIES